MARGRNRPTPSPGHPEPTISWLAGWRRGPEPIPCDSIPPWPRAARRTGDAEGERICTDAYQAFFLADHLGRWYGVFLERLAQATDEPFYLELGRLMAAFLDRECAALTPRPRPLCTYSNEMMEGTTWRCPAAGGASAEFM